MNNHSIIKKRFKRRLFIFGTVKCSAILCLVGRLYYLQGIKYPQYKLLSDHNRIKSSLINSIRGKIFDSNGIQLASNKKQYNLAFTPMKGLNIEYLTIQLVNILQITEPKCQELYNLLNNTSETVVIIEGINWQMLQRIEFNIHNLHGILIIIDYKRYYHRGVTISHVIGFARRVMYTNGMYRYVGKSGMEYTCDKRLQGNPGIKQEEINYKRQIVRPLSIINGQEGENIYLSIDYNLQNFIFNTLKQNGSIVVLNIRNGNILAMNNFPSYDNNLFIKSISQQQWKQIINNQNYPLLNRAVALQIPPGSTFKIISALAALEQGIITENTSFNCNGSMNIGGNPFHCWNKSGHGTISLNEAISLSCNTYFYNIGKMINAEQLFNMAKIFGLGVFSGLGLKEELPGIIPDNSWQEKYHRNSHWYLGDTINSIIGHGYILTTPLQLAIMTARIATGKVIYPSLINNPPIRDFTSLHLKHDFLEIVRYGMYNAVNNKYGTARKAYSSKQKIAGKTGTAQVVQSGKIYSKNSHALFVGYAPYDEPKYAISVVIEHSEYSGSATKIAKEIFDYMHDHNQ